jgi:predicted nucleic acid-binding protein
MAHMVISKRKATEDRLWSLFDKIREEKRPVGVTAFAKEAGIDRSYLYTFHELATEISAYAVKTQPKKSRRGAAVSKTQAMKKGIEDRVRREHTMWSKEVPELKERLSEATSVINELKEENANSKNSAQRFKRACELLLLLASEAGANPRELEEVSRKAFTERT